MQNDSQTGLYITDVGL